jgi:hypothetical protein
MSWPPPGSPFCARNVRSIAEVDQRVDAVARAQA